MLRPKSAAYRIVPAGATVTKPRQRVSLGSGLAGLAADAADQHSGPQVGVEHRSYLGAEERVVAEDRGSLRDQGIGVFGRLGVLDDPLGCPVVVELVQVVDLLLACPAPGSDAADRGDLRAEGQDRLDLERRPDEGR